MQHPESFRNVQVRTRSGESKWIWAFTKTVRLKKFGRKRLVIIHEQEEKQPVRLEDGIRDAASPL
jgi:hypothetical protein